jgi:serine/threonine-protein kinase
MDCGEANHILLSHRVTDDLAQYSEWQPSLHDLGEVEVKHGVRIALANFFGDGFGNPKPPAKIIRARQVRRRRRLLWLSAIPLILLFLTIGSWVWTRRAALTSAYKIGAAGISEKSIAVMPLENLSEEKENAYFADGIQDELLSNLSKIKDLKVISRTSVMQYKSGIRRNLKEIAQQLGVSKVVEGSVRRSGNHVRVSVQLIDALTDRHIWAENYDRTLADSLAMQGELATEIAASVGATLTPQEKARVQAQPTNNADAYDAYLRGRAITILAMSERANLERAVRSYEEAVKLDPNFALAWVYLSRAQSIYYRNYPSPARLAAAKDALDRALALDPNLPEAHLARGYYRYQVERDFSGALSEFQKAEQGLPNNADIFTAISMIQRRRGRSDEALEAARRAVALDPRNRDACFFLATTYGSQRRFHEAIATADRVLAFDPTDLPALNGKVYGYLAIGDLKGAEPLLANPGIEPNARGLYAFLQRNYAAAAEIFSKTTADDADRDWTEVFALGICQKGTGNVAASQETFRGAIQGIQRELAQAGPDPLVQAELYGLLGVAYALLGEAAPAIAEGEKAIALKSTSEDSFEGPKVEETVAQIYAALGDADHAVTILKRLLQIPYRQPITTGRLRIDPFWDPIRNDPRFQELVAEKPR